MSQKVLFDIDPGCDDAVMLAMALGSDDIEVVGISTVAGNSTVPNTTRNALSILTLADRTDVPVARGCDRPLVDSLTPAEWIHGEGGIRGDLPAPDAEPVGTAGPEFVVEQSRTHGEDLTIVAVGPMTNLAVALALDPEIPERVDDVHLMGGAAMTAGNATPMAEANFHNDAAAASRVIQDAEPKMVGLDVTNRATVDLDYAEQLESGSPAAQIVADWLDYPDVVRKFGDGVPVHDAAVTAHLLEDVLTFERYYVEIDTTGGPCHGAVVCDQHEVIGEPPNVDVATEIDVQAFRDVLEGSVDRFIEMCRRGV